MCEQPLEMVASCNDRGDGKVNLTVTVTKMVQKSDSDFKDLKFKSNVTSNTSTSHGHMKYPIARPTKVSCRSRPIVAVRAVAQLLSYTIIAKVKLWTPPKVKNKYDVKAQDQVRMKCDSQ